MRALKSRAAFGSLSSVLVKIFRRSCYEKNQSMPVRTSEMAILTIHPCTFFFHVDTTPNFPNESLVDLSTDHNVEIARSYRFRENRQYVELSCRVYVFAFHIYMYEEGDIPDKLSYLLDFHIQLVVDCLPVRFFSWLRDPGFIPRRNFTFYLINSPSCDRFSSLTKFIYSRRFCIRV